MTDTSLAISYELTGAQMATLDDLRSGMVRGVETCELTRVEPAVEHYHADGLYGRRIFVDAGTTVLTMVHKSEHITVALKGHCTVVDEKGERHEVYAPSVFVTQPGTQRAVYCHDDVEWLTVHACQERDLGVIESLLVCGSMDEYNRVIEAKL